jgi:Alpha/beta hydrolase domain/Glycoside hydrolase 97/Glycosyl-hydrolase 97 C-terminal, oligomerisation
VMVARDLNTLVNSDVVHNLAAPPDSKLFPQGVKTAWLKPGRAVWRYLDGGENTLDGIKEFSRLAGELGFEYQVVEGQWQKWTDAELRDLVQYSKARGVGIMVWRHRRTLGTPEDRRKLFASLRNAGVVGVKVDFLDHEAKEVIDLYQDILRDAAEHQLMVNFHGANKPAGEARTWPNEMTREAIYGLEHKRIEAWAAFNSTFPFTRMLAGHADYTPVVFGERRRETSIAHQIASAAILTSPLLVYGGHPASLLASPAVEIIKSIPSVWDETRVLQPSEIGELALFARRSGTAWFVAAMNGPTAQTVKVSLSFLPKGTYQALVARDNAEDVAAVVVERGTRTAGETLEIPMRAGGGFVVRLHPSGASVSTAKITGPIPSTTAPGDRSHNYPFFSTKHLVEKDDYVEEEFYVEGLAVEYAGAVDQTATVAPGGPYPYKTRAIVRRPKSARRFNGTVILEWTNVAAGFGIDNDWYWSHEHLMRRGFAHIGVIVEPAGIHSPRGLKQWNPGRYGSLDLTANGTFSNLQAGFELSFSIFSQVARAIKNPSGVGLLRNLKARNVVATGHSRSSGRLSAYYNRIHPSDGIVDGFVFHGAGGLIRTDIRTPAWKLLAETDVIWAQAPIRQPDSPYFRTWEVAGASHADWDLMRVVDDLGKRDLTPPDPAPCDPPDGSRVPSRLAQDALYDWMKLWVERRTPPPQAPQIALSSIGTRETGPNAPPSSVARRDEHGNAQGGIRLAQFAVATATNTGLRSNTPPGNCRNRGVYTPFTADTIARLYPTRAKYIAEVHRITDENLKAGYITKEGATQTKNDAAQWKPGAQ